MYEELPTIYKEAFVTYSTYFPAFFCRDRGKPENVKQYNEFHSWDSNQASFRYELEALPLHHPIQENILMQEVSFRNILCSARSVCC